MPHVLYGIEIRRMRRKINEPASGGLDELSDLRGLAERGVVHECDLAFAKEGRKARCNPSDERGRIGRSLEKEVRAENAKAKRGDHIDSRVALSGEFRMDLFAFRSASVTAIVSDVDPAFVDIYPIF